MIDPDALLDAVLEVLEDRPKPSRLGKIDPAYVAGTDPRVVWDGEDAATTKRYKALGSYTPKADDRVVAVQAGSTWVILGQIGGQDGVPAGGIIMWSGAVGEIPDGFALCDGTNGTPNLADRFVVAAGGAFDVGDTGGTDDATMPEHTHTSGSLAAGTGGFHAHNVDYRTVDDTGAAIPRATGGAAVVSQNTAGAGSHGHSISGSTGQAGGAGDNRPRFYALAYIMRLA